MFGIWEITCKVVTLTLLGLLTPLDQWVLEKCEKDLSFMFLHL